MRLFARAVQQGAAAASATTRSSETPTSPNAAQSNYHPSAASAAPAAAKRIKTKAGGVAKGAKRFGEAVWGPMALAAGVLWLEITGLFFALFAIFFAQNVYKFRQDYATGPEHAHFLVYAALTVVFAAFTVTQFYKARRKEKKRVGNRE